MSSIPILEVVSFSTEHSTHRITNLIKGTGKWTIPIKNISASRGQEITDLEAEFRLPPCQIEALDIGNFWTAILDIEVGRSGESASQRKPLLEKNSSILFMNKLDCRTENNFEMVKFFQKSDINSEVSNSSKPWDRLRVVCKQPHRNDVLFGLSLLKIRGQRLDNSSQIFHHPNLENLLPPAGKNMLEIDKNQDKEVPKNSSNPNHPEWFVPGSRASKLLEKSTTKNKFNFKTKQQQKENISGIFNENSTMSPLRRKLRDEDDLAQVQEPPAKKISKPTSRNDIVSHDNTRSLIQKKIEVKTNPSFFAGPSGARASGSSTKADVAMNKEISKVVEINVKNDLLKYSTQQLKSKGILVQHKTYKKSRDLPLKKDKQLKIQAGQEIRFYKLGPQIFLTTLGKVYDPQVEPEHVGGIFKDYTADEIFASDFMEFHELNSTDVHDPNQAHSSKNTSNVTTSRDSIKPDSMIDQKQQQLPPLAKKKFHFTKSIKSKDKVNTTTNINSENDVKTKIDSDHMVTQDITENAKIYGLVKISKEKLSALPGTSKTSSEKIKENDDTVNKHFQDTSIDNDNVQVKINSKKDFGKYSKKQLKAKGVLVQVRTYKKPRELPLKNDKTLQIKAGQKVCFYKFGPLIHLITEGEIHDPDVEPEDIRGIFNEYTEEQVLASDIMKLPLPQFLKQKTSKEATEEEVEESRQSKKETIKKSSSTSIVSCSTCKKQVPKSNIELHKFKCTSDLRPSTSNSTPKPNNQQFDLELDDLQAIPDEKGRVVRKSKYHPNKSRELLTLDDSDNEAFSPSLSPDIRPDNPISESISAGAAAQEKFGKCPMCDKSFSLKELTEHAATCNGLEEFSAEICPICNRQYPPEQLPLHAQECAQRMFEDDPNPTEFCPICKCYYPKHRITSHAEECAQWLYDT